MRYLPQLTIVACPECGFVANDLHAVGGTIDDEGNLAVTVACLREKKLYDAPAGNVSDWDVELEDGLTRPMTVEDVDADEDDWDEWEVDDCPTCGRPPASFDPLEPVCPVCGSACYVTSVEGR